VAEKPNDAQTLMLDEPASDEGGGVNYRNENLGGDAVDRDRWDRRKRQLKPINSDW
jgi:hypothetical protein